MDPKKLDALSAPKRVKISNATYSYNNNQEDSLLGDGSLNPILKRPKFINLQKQYIKLYKRDPNAMQLVSKFVYENDDDKDNSKLTIYENPAE